MLMHPGPALQVRVGARDGVWVLICLDSGSPPGQSRASHHGAGEEDESTPLSQQALSGLANSGQCLPATGTPDSVFEMRKEL